VDGPEQAIPPQAPLAEDEGVADDSVNETRLETTENPDLKTAQKKPQLRELTGCRRITAIILLAFVLLLLAFVLAGVVITNLPISEPLTALDLESEVHRLAAEGERWTGFDPLKYPLAIYDGENTYLFRHPHRPKGFKPLAGQKDAFVYSGQYERVYDYHMVDISDEPTAIVTLDGDYKYYCTYDARIAIHELFHVYQDKCEEIWPTTKWKPIFTYPCYDINLYKDMKLEERALAHALESKSQEGKKQWALLALSYAMDAEKKMPRESSDNIKAWEMREGLASYVEALYDEDSVQRQRELISKLERGFGPEEFCDRTYTTGRALGVLLDQFKPDWKKTFNKKDYTWLEDTLAQALGQKAGGNSEFTEEELREIEKDARQEITEAIHERISRTRSFSEIGGGVLIVVCGADPFYLNAGAGSGIRMMLGGNYVSRRDTGLENDNGSIIIPEYDTLLEPLPISKSTMRFSKAIVRGLEEEWEISFKDGVLKLRSGLLHGELRSAQYTLKNGVLTIFLDNEIPAGQEK
jgi:hypothetical protein